MIYCSNLGLFVGELWAVCLQDLHDALHTAGAEQPEVREKKHKVISIHFHLGLLWCFQDEQTLKRSNPHMH